MALQEVIVTFLYSYAPLLSFFAGLVAGDVLILLAVFAGAGQIELWVVFLFGLLGEIAHDSAFYFISNSSLAHYIKRKLKLSRKRNIIAQFIEKVGGKSYFLPLFFAKFIYGVRDVTILYISHNERNFKRYFIITTIVSLIWMSIVLSIGWLAGRGFTEILYVLHGIERGLFIIVLAIVVLYLLNRFVISTFMKYIIKKSFN